MEDQGQSIIDSARGRQSQEDRAEQGAEGQLRRRLNSERPEKLQSLGVHRR